jgi:hypothetical protein
MATMLLLTICAYAFYIAIAAINGQWGMLIGSIQMTDQFCERLGSALIRGCVIQLVGWLVYIAFHIFRKVVAKEDEERV